jgi:LPS O-antigen subunit length determinant protein (WzzB/FepE family)
MNQTDLNNESIKLLSKIYKWRKPLIIVTSIAAIISIIVSFIIAPQFKATAIVFPSRTFSVSKLLVEQNVGNQEDYMELGDEDDAEKLLQILNSTEIRQRVAEEYDLWKNWKIKKDDIYSAHYFKLKWDEMVSFKRTDYVSIKVDVYDYEAGRAANIANSIIRYADSVKFRMSKVVAKEALSIIEEEYANTITRTKELEDSLQAIKELGVLDYKYEMIAYSKRMAKAVAKGDKQSMANLQVKLDLIKKYGMQYDNLFENLKKYRFKYPVIKQKYDEALVNYSRQLPSKFVVDKAVPNEKKAKPVRAIIVLVPTISTFLLALLYLMFADRIVELKKKIVAQSKEENL